MNLINTSSSNRKSNIQMTEAGKILRSNQSNRSYNVLGKISHKVIGKQVRIKSQNKIIGKCIKDKGSHKIIYKLA